MGITKRNKYTEFLISNCGKNWNQVIFCAESGNLIIYQSIRCYFPNLFYVQKMPQQQNKKGEKVQLEITKKFKGIEFRFYVSLSLSLLWLGVSFQLVAILPNRGRRGCRGKYVSSLKRIKIWDLHGCIGDIEIHYFTPKFRWDAINKKIKLFKGSCWSCITIAIFPYQLPAPTNSLCLCCSIYFIVWSLSLEVNHSLQNASLGSSSFQRAFSPSSSVRHPCPNRRHCDRRWKRQSSLWDASFDPHRQNSTLIGITWSKGIHLVESSSFFHCYFTLPVDCFTRSLQHFTWSWRWVSILIPNYATL